MAEELLSEDTQVLPALAADADLGAEMGEDTAGGLLLRSTQEALAVATERLSTLERYSHSDEIDPSMIEEV